MIRVEDIIREHTTIPIPRFVVRAMERLLHERDINRLLQGGEGLSPQAFLRYVFRELAVRSRAQFLSPLDSTGRYLFVANHPFGALDGMMLADMLLERWCDVGVVVNDMLQYVEPLQALWIPVSKRGRQSAVSRGVCLLAADSLLPCGRLLPYGGWSGGGPKVARPLCA
mgnify:CR=1 FL=1